MWLLLTRAIPAHCQAAISSHPALTDRGYVEGLTYYNAALGFTYQLPEGFFVNPLPDKLPAGSLLMIADKHNGTPWRDRMLMAADNAAKYSWTTSEYASHVVRSLPGKRVVVLRETYPLKVAGQDFVRIDYQRIDNGKVLYQSFVCTRLKDSLVSWTFVSLNHEELGKMAASINTVTIVRAPSKPH